MPYISQGKFVVVGGASLVGSHLGEQLLAGGAREVVLLDNLSLGDTSTIDFLLKDPRCIFVRADALRLNELYDPMDGADGVFGVAGFLGAPMRANPWVGIDVNIRGFQNMLEAARYQKVKKVIFSSSSGVYGAMDASDPNTEDSPLRWAGMPPALVLYCASKIMGEALGNLYAAQYGIDFIALRYGAIYGERQHRRALMSTEMVKHYERVRAGKPPLIDGEGASVQDYVYVGDVARANVMGMESTASGVALNILSGVDTSQKEVIAAVLEACKSDLKPERSVNAGGLSMPQQTKQGYNVERAKKTIGWEPQVGIKEGVARLVAWLDKQQA